MLYCVVCLQFQRMFNVVLLYDLLAVSKKFHVVLLCDLLAVSKNISCCVFE